MLLKQPGDAVFVQVAAGDDARLGQSGLVEHLPRGFGQLGQVAGIQPHAQEPMPGRFQLLSHLDRMLHALQRVVGIHQQDGVVGQSLGVGAERFQLGVEGHDPTVGVGAADRNTVQLAGQHVTCAGAAAHVGGPGGRHAAIGPLGSPQAELQHGPAAGSQVTASRFGGHQRGKVDQVQQRGFQQLALKQRPLHPQERLAREHQLPFGHGPDVALPAQLFQVAKELLGKQRLPVASGQRGQVVQIVAAEAAAAQVLHSRLHATGDGKAAPERQTPKEQVEHRLTLGQSGSPVAVGHGQLVEVRKQAQAVGVQASQGIKHRQVPPEKNRFRRQRPRASLVRKGATFPAGSAPCCPKPHSM